MSIPEVIGDIDISVWAQQITKNCGVEQLEVDARHGSLPSSYDMLRGVITVKLAAPSEHRRQDDLRQNDALIASLLDMLPSSNYTVLHTTSPNGVVTKPESTEYIADIQEALHMDLRRDLGLRASNSSGNQTVVDGPLFHKYQFFTPGKYLVFQDLDIADN